MLSDNDSGTKGVSQLSSSECMLVYMLKREGMVALLRPVLEEGRTHT